MVFGGGYLLWYLRTDLTRICAVYGFVSIALIVNSGATLSVNRYVYGIVSVSVALGLLLSRNRRWGYATMGLFGVSLIGFAIHFARWGFIA
jgi:Gpi18-like mannosyltransferase